MELELTSDQKFFAETTRSFLTDSCPTSALREARDDPDGFNRGYWRQGAELGWTTLLVSEKDGGGSISGRGVNDLTLVAFEFGRFAAPGPLTATNIVAGALARSGSEEQKAEVLPDLMSGAKVGSWAYAEPRPFDRLGEVLLEAKQTNGGYVLNGRKTPVEAAGQSDVLLVTARDGDGLTQFLVPIDTPGVSVTPMKTVDLTRRFGRVTFDQVALPASAVVGEAGNAADDVESQLQIAVVIQLAEIVGAMDRALEITSDWLFNRYSFGRPLASYQELKHRFVDMRAWLEAGNAIADAAAGHVQDETDRAAEYVSAGKSYLGVYGPEALHDCVQMHGGIGVTFEHDLHLFLRRVTLDAHLYGTVADHRERLTTILEQQESSND
ncbi:MAG: acyl-CoA dehydrogenase domain protein [Frankiales bacterium]|nr:acyl-CoA dehydrogenase domain protein [Frankiales bacterium]